MGLLTWQWLEASVQVRKKGESEKEERAEPSDEERINEDGEVTSSGDEVESEDGEEREEEEIEDESEEEDIQKPLVEKQVASSAPIDPEGVSDLMYIASLTKFYGDEIPVKLNKQLYSWVIENLVKNETKVK